MKKLLPYFVGVMIVTGLIVGLMLITKRDSSPSENTTQASNSSNETSEQADTNQVTEETTKSYSKAEVAVHNKKSDCWTIISGFVYDITSYVPRHPGGDEILRACGADGTSLFQTRTTNSGEQVGSGTSHSNSAESQLASLKVGTLSD